MPPPGEESVALQGKKEVKMVYDLNLHLSERRYGGFDVVANIRRTPTRLASESEGGAKLCARMRSSF